MSADRDRHHPYFGPLRYDDELNWWEASFESGGTSLTVHFSLDECEDEEALIATGEAVLRDLASWRRRVEDLAVQKLLSIKNKSWLEDDEPEIGEDEFRSSLSPDAVTIYPDGALEFLYRDGGLFWGHCVLVSATVQDGPTEADIAG